MKKARRGIAFILYHISKQAINGNLHDFHFEFACIHALPPFYTKEGGASIKAELKYKAICMIPHTQDIRERANPRSIAFP